jgi:hypothetical protein
MGELGQDNQVRTTVAWQPGHGSRDRDSRDRTAGQHFQDWKTGTSQTQHVGLTVSLDRSDWTGPRRKYGLNMAGRQEQLGQHNRSSKARANQPRQDSQDRTVSTGQSGQVGLTSQPGQSREDRTARTRHQGLDSSSGTGPTDSTDINQTAGTSQSGPDDLTNQPGKYGQNMAGQPGQEYRVSQP